MYKHLFPIFDHHPSLHYLDSAATTQKPKSVTNRLLAFYGEENANIHRGLYDLSWKATEAFEHARNTIASFLGTSSKNIVFTKGTTDAVNLVASSLSKKVSSRSNLITSISEHHANFIPWQQTCFHSKADFRVVRLNERLEIDLNHLESQMDDKTEILAVQHISNTTGAINPIKHVCQVAKDKGVPVFVDGAQAAALHGINVSDLGCDFYAFSMHKAFGPFGVGVFYVSDSFIDSLQPVHFGGGSIERVRVEDTTFLPFPHNLEPGTQSVAEVIASEEAIRFINSLDLSASTRKIFELETLLREELAKIDGIRVVGPEATGAGIVSFYHDHIHPHDLASFLNQSNVAVRAGLHCTQPLLDFLSIPATIRASFSVYNDEDDVRSLTQSLLEAIELMA